MKKLILIMCGIVFLSGCKSQPTISFEKAIDGINYALTKLKEQAESDKNFGLIPIKIDAAFNISSDKNEKLSVAPISIKDYTSTITETASNKITIEIRSIYFDKDGNPKDEIIRENIKNKTFGSLNAQ